MSAKTTGIVLGVACCAIVGLAVAAAVKKQIDRGKAMTAVAAAPGPKVELPIDYDEPLKVINVVNKAKGDARAQLLTSFVGRYTPSPGWEGTVEAITNESGGRVALRLRYLASTVIGGEYWVVAIVAPDHGAKEGQTLRVHGCVKDVLFQTGAATVTQSVILDDVRVVP